MFGYVLVSNKNTVISFDGDQEFNDYVNTRIRDEAHFSADCPSTSSAICTDSSVKTLCGVGEPTRAVLRNHLPSTNDEVSHLFLPIISICRLYLARNGDRILSVTCDQTRILLRHLKSNYLLFSIGTSEERQYQFLDFVELGLELNIGPLLGLIDSKLTTVRLGSEFLKSVSEIDLLENHKIREYLDVRRALFFKAELSFILPFLKSLSSLLQNTLGTNRCFLLNDNEVLASYTSDEKSIWKKIPVTDLNIFFKLLSTQKFLKHYETVSIWLRLYESVIPILTDVTIYNNGDGLILLCLSETKYSSLISTIAKLLLQLDQLALLDDVTRKTRIIRRTVDIISQELLAIAAANKPRKKAGFLRNPSLTASFFQTIWQRTEDLFKAPCEGKILPSHNLGSINSSLMSLKSALSTASLSSSIKLRPHVERQKFSPKCEMMIDYVCRQVTNLLHELCFDCYGTSEAKVARFSEIISNLGSTLPRNLISDRNMAQALAKKSALLKDFMSPATLGLDMIAYSVSIPLKHITLDFVPDWISDQFNSSLRSLKGCSCITTLSAISEKRYKLFRMDVEHEPQRPGFGALKFLRGDVATKMITVAVFEEGIYNPLAERQISTLLSFIAAQMSSGALLLS